jgi:hypothetical protein
VSHIPQSGDATTSPAGDADVSAGMRISKGDDTSPERDAVSPEENWIESKDYHIVLCSI